MNSNEDFARYLGVDYEKKYGYIRVCCPEHNDRHPSLVIYPELDNGAYCFVCGKAYNWCWLAHLIKGIPYKQACEEIGQPLADNGGIEREFKRDEITFCDNREQIYIDAYNQRHTQCSTEYPQEMIDWLNKKHLFETAKKLDWRWHDGTVFKGWGKGIVIPYFKLSTKDIDYERIREWNGKGFDKPKGSFSMTIEPYFSTFRPNAVQFICEGECLLPSAEVLTEKDGWVRFDNYDGKQKIAQWGNGKIEFVLPSAVICKDHINGRIFTFKKKGFEISTTPKHRILRLRPDGTEYVIKAQDFRTCGWHIPRCGTSSAKGLSYTDEQLRVVIAVQADCTIRESGYCYANYKKERKYKRWNKILTGAGITFKNEKCKNREGYYNALFHPDFKCCKEFPMEWLGQISSHQARVMLDEIKYWDGNSVKGRTMTEYSTVSKNNAVFVQTLCHLAGCVGTIVERKFNGTFGKKDKVYYVVHILNGKRYTSDQNLKPDIETYTGKVYCVSVPSTFFLVRQNGCISVTGNTDAASLYEHGYSALGLPGAVTKKAINTIVATLNDLDFVKSIIVCGDNDDAGSSMNNLVTEAVHKIAPRLVVKPYKHVLNEKGCDMNDEHAKGLLKLPVEFGANYGENFKRNYPESSDFYEYIEDLEKRDAEAKARGDTIWMKHRNLWIEKD